MLISSQMFQRFGAKCLAMRGSDRPVGRLRVFKVQPSPHLPLPHDPLQQLATFFTKAYHGEILVLHMALTVTGGLQL